MKKASFEVVFLLCAMFSGGAAFADCASDLASLQSQGSLSCVWQTTSPLAGGAGMISRMNQLQSPSSAAQCVASCASTILSAPDVTSTGTYYFFTNSTCSWNQGNIGSINCGVFSSFSPS